MNKQTKLYAKVIAKREDLPDFQSIRFYSGKIGEVIDAPPGRDVSNAVWLKFGNSKIAWFYYKEVQLLTDEDVPPKYLQVPIGKYDGIELENIHIDEDHIVWIEVESPDRNCEVNYDGI